MKLSSIGATMPLIFDPRWQRDEELYLDDPRNIERLLKMSLLTNRHLYFPGSFLIDYGQIKDLIINKGYYKLVRETGEKE